MIKRIELRNFMSHAHTVIEPAAGLTVLIGPNNIGKSAVVAALQVLCHNDNSTYVMKHGEKECSVTVETDDGHHIEWKRRTSPSYTIDGQKFDRLKNNSPPELQAALRLPLVTGSSNAEFDVHFGSQKSPIFLLDSTGANAARFFASSSDASKLVEMQKRHKEKHAQAKRERTRLEQRATEVNRELERLQPVVTLQAQLDALEELYDAWQACAQSIAAGRLLMDRWRSLHRQRARDQQQLAALSSLAEPPALHETARLRENLNERHNWQRSHGQFQQQRQSLSLLAAPPALEETATLQRVLSDLRSIRTQQQQLAERQSVWNQLPAPPAVDDPQPLRNLLQDLRSATAAQASARARHAALEMLVECPALESLEAAQRLQRDWQTALAEVQRCATEQAQISEELMVLEQELQQQSDGQTCPTCGAELDGERLLQHLAGRAEGLHA